MPKAARSASASVASGYGPRRTTGDTTPSGRARSSPRWSARAAVPAQQQLKLLCRSWSMTLQQVTERILSDRTWLDVFLHGTAMSRASAYARDTASAIFLDKIAKVQAAPHRLAGIAQETRERVRAHAGPDGRLEKANTDDGAPPAPGAGAWLDRAAPANLRRPPPAGGRLLEGLAKWGLQRLGPLPRHAVVCFERAEGRVRKWRADAGEAEDAPPPLSLLRALVFLDELPTAVGSPGDHYWLVAEERWMSVTETMRLFGLRDTDLLWPVLATGPKGTLTARQACAALGRAVHTRAASYAVDMALSRLGLSADAHVRYASACSGVDLFAAALEHSRGTNWSYSAAAERDERVAATLLAAYGVRGLTRDAIASDAREARRVAGLDLWAFSPPCEAYSRRNHARSEGGMRDASSDFLDMLDSVRLSAPRAIIIENVA
jgi:hypothetical protein